MPLRDVLNGFLKTADAFFGIPPPGEGDPDVGVLGIPYDLTSSFSPGSRFGPRQLRHATTAQRSHSRPTSLGFVSYEERPLLSETITLEDIGDLEIELRLPEAAMYDISDAAQRLAERNSCLLFLGGDHFITYPLLKGLKRGRPGEYGLVWLDSHADFYKNYGGYKLSHATTLRNCINDGLVDTENVVGHDLRSAHPDQRRELAGREDVPIYDLDAFSETVQDIAERVDYIHISVDLDVLRPEVAPGVSHPESGGLHVEDVCRLLRVAFTSQKVRHADIVELNPMLDSSGLTAIAARDILKEILAGFAVQKSLKE
ncbi:arginase family protein [Candidatus Thorarchaeota archaeon]|nr:MAG: arginase family protein [Candidatus Thorarchaeota archaeon]